jgi:phosphohistidine phosphatase
MQSKLRRISILRHAKAEAAEGIAQDHDRTLTRLGVSDAERMGAWMLREGNLPDRILCSSAVRTRDTFTSLGFSRPVEYLERLYLASAGEMLHQLQSLDAAVQHVLVIGHNPGVLETVVWLMAEAVHEKDIRQLTRKFPTCTLAELEVPLAHWRDLAPASATLTRVILGRDLPEIRTPKRA